MENADRSRRRLRALAGVVGLGVIACGVVNAAPVTWTGTAGDSFNDGTKWTPAAPTSADVAIFDNDTNGNVNFSANANPQGILYRNASGAITMALGGNTLSLGSTTTTGTIALGGAAGKVNDVTFSGGRLDHTHASGAMLTVGIANSHGNKVTFSGASMLSTGVSTGSAFATIGVANSNNNQLNVINGASVIWRGTVNVGVVSTSSGNSINVNDATFSSQGGSRGINLRNGTLALTKTYTDVGFLDVDDAGNTTTLTFNSGTLFSRRTQINNGKDFVIGDGGVTPAKFLLAHSGGSLTLGADTDLVINSNGILSGHGSGTLSSGGEIRGIAGAKVSPYYPDVVANLADDRIYGSLTFATPTWDNSNIDIEIDVGDFPTAASAPSPYTPLDFVNIIGSFVHGGTVSFNMSGFEGPSSGLATEFKVVGWTTEQGLSSATSVEFVNGISLPYRFGTDGLYLTVPEPGSLSAIATIVLFAGRRRLR